MFESKCFCNRELFKVLLFYLAPVVVHFSRNLLAGNDNARFEEIPSKMVRYFFVMVFFKVADNFSDDLVRNEPPNFFEIQQFFCWAMSLFTIVQFGRLTRMNILNRNQNSPFLIGSLTNNRKVRGVLYS